MLQSTSNFLRSFKPVLTTLAKNYTRSGRSVFRNIVQRDRVKRLFSSKNLLLSNTVICVGMSGLGDVVLQSAQSSKKSFDMKRTLHLSLTGFTVGPICHYWYQMLERRMPGKTMSMIAKKVVVDQIVFSPVCLAVFFLTLGLLDNSSLKQIGKEIYHKGLVLYTAEWFVWPPAQVINFYLIPLRFRVLFDNLVSFGFDIFQSHVRYSDLADDGDEEQEKEMTTVDEKNVNDKHVNDKHVTNFSAKTVMSE